MSTRMYWGALAITLAVLVSTCAWAKTAKTKIIPNRYVIQVADGVDIDQVADEIRRYSRGQKHSTYRHALRGFCLSVPPGIAKKLLREWPGVVTIEPDVIVTTCAQTIPTCVDRIDIDLDPIAKIDGIDERIDIDIAVVDTGIDVDHPDLNVVGGVRFTNNPPSTPDDYDDDNGHGTEVSGVLAALDNGIGIVGAAPGARLWSVKSFDYNRSGTLSSILAGLDWVVDNADTIEVANMSWSGVGITPAGRQAIQNAVAAGVVCFTAAGNSGADVYGGDGMFNTGDDVWPASYPEVATISAMADTDGQAGGLGNNSAYGGYSDDSFAGFSNFNAAVHASNPVNSPGGAIDLLMPAVDIYSTFIGGGYSFDTGTSLASPLAAGLCALYIAEHGRATNASEVYAIRQALIDGAVLQSSVRGLNVQNDPDSQPEKIGYRLSADDCDTVWQLGLGIETDFNQDCYVDELDLLVLVSAWLQCNDPENSDCSDVAPGQPTGGEWSEDFEDMVTADLDVYPWSVRSGSPAIAAGGPSPSTKCVELNAGDVEKAVIPLGVTTGGLEFDLYVAAGGSFRWTAKDGLAWRVVRLYFLDGGGEIDVATSGAGADLVTGVMPYNAWAHFKLDFDHTTKLFDLEIGGSPVYTDMPYLDPATSFLPLDAVYWELVAGNDVQFDNMLVTGPFTCADIWTEGTGFPEDFNQDCYVNGGDVPVFIPDWGRCNDPCNPSCEQIGE